MLYCYSNWNTLLLYAKYDVTMNCTAPWTVTSCNMVAIYGHYFTLKYRCHIQEGNLCRFSALVRHRSFPFLLSLQCHSVTYPITSNFLCLECRLLIPTSVYQTTRLHVLKCTAAINSDLTKNLSRNSFTQLTYQSSNLDLEESSSVS